MHLSVEFQSLRVLPRPVRILFALLAAGALSPVPAADQAPPFASPIRAIAYPGRAGAMPAMPCLYARDLPLLALMGANTVRTYGLLPEGDRTFVAVLDSTGLNWLAGFPLDGFYDSGVTIAAQEDRILAAFRSYAARFRGQKRLAGYIFGDRVTSQYGRKFAGPRSDFYALLTAAAAVLREIEPGRTPLLATAVRDADEMANDVPGLSFWVWDGRSRPLPDIRRKATRPVVVSADASAVEELESAEGILGGVYGSFVDSGDAGVFRSAPTEYAGYETLSPRPVYYTLAGLWGGTFPSVWEEKDQPRLGSPDGPASAGALVRLAGTGLLNTAAPYSDESWPYHLAGTCLCVAGAPARLSFVSEHTITAQVPLTAEPGSRPLVFYRAGQASNFSSIHVSEFSAVGFTGPVLEARLHGHAPELSPACVGHASAYGHPGRLGTGTGARESGAWAALTRAERSGRVSPSPESSRNLKHR